MPETLTSNGLIQDAIACFVATANPFDCNIQKFMDAIDFRRPGKPEDGTTGFIAFDIDGDKSRLKLTTGKYLVRKCGLNKILSDSDLRTLAVKINSLLWTEDELQNIELVNGKKIVDAYEKSIGGNSCMTGSCAEYTRFYADNPMRFRMLITKSGNDSARAIVHKLDNGKYFLDRIYSTATYLVQIMENYATTNNWYSRKNLSAIPDDVLVISGLHFTDGEIPYMDTFYCGSIINGLLTISVSTGEYALQNQDGMLDEGYCCAHCGDHILRDDYVYSESGDVFCCDCYHELFFMCEHCEDESDRSAAVCIEDLGIHVCEYCARSDYYCCGGCGTVNSLDGTHTVEYDVLCDGCYEETAGQCDDCGELYFNENLFRTDKGAYCSDCNSQHQDAIETPASEASV